MINATDSGIKRELVPAGNHVARCYSMIHIGTIDEPYMGQLKSMNKVRITWELPGELRVFNEDKGEQPMVISQEFTLSMHEKSNLRRMLESWRGKGFTDDEAECFDITKLLGVPCMLSVIHKVSQSGNEYATISSVAAMPKGVVCPPQINDMFEWNYDDPINEEALEFLPEFLRDKIKSSLEYRDMKSPESKEVKEDEPDDLPF